LADRETGYDRFERQAREQPGTDPPPGTRLLSAGAAALGLRSHPALAHDDDEKVLTEALVLRDPDVP
jgi:hypothetical protein